MNNEKPNRPQLKTVKQKTEWLTLHAFLIVYWVILAPAMADQHTSNICTEAPLDASSYFPNFTARANQLRRGYCAQQLDVFQTQDAIVDAAKHGVSVWQELDNTLILAGGLPFSVTPLYQALELSHTDPSGLGIFSYQRFGPKVETTLGSVKLYDLQLSTCDTHVQSTFGSGNCTEFLSEFERVYTYAHQTLAAPLAQTSFDNLVKIEMEWNDYFEKGRSQFPWELWINYQLWKSDRQPGRFTPPPKHQWIFLHPSIVIENVSDAVDGENTKEAIMIEVFGYNRWDKDKWYQPSGISLVSLYADRNMVKDWGYGVAVHFGNDFTLGYSKHDDENGIFVSVDLWKLFTDKQSQLQKFRDKF